MILEHKMPTVSDLVEIPLAIFITLATNNCGREGKAKEFVVNWVHALSLKYHAESSK